MRILICNERFLFRFGVDRVLLLLGTNWKKAGHEIIMMGNKLDELVADKCSDRFIQIPEAEDYLHGNDFTLDYLKEHWNEWFLPEEQPEAVLIAGWPFYRSIAFLREKCGYAVFHDYGAVPMDGMSKSQEITQKELRRLRKENIRNADRVIAISRYIETSQSRPDTDALIPTSYVYLGADHMDQAIWQKEDLKIQQNDVLSEVRKLKKQGYKIIFQPGRWETGNYKNSAASVPVARILKENGLRIKILVLSKREDMDTIPGDVADCYYSMGYIDDFTLKAVIEYADVGFSPTLWEGFNLPLAEMQYLYKHMYVYDAGAHPEVAAHPFFICHSQEEAAEKIFQDLSGRLPVNEDELNRALEKFHQKFTWKKCADTMLCQMQKDMVLSGVVFIDVTNACHDTANSGVMRVTRKVSRHIQQKMETIFVLWDDCIHKYVFPYESETDLLCNYEGAYQKKIIYRSKEGAPRTRLDEILGQFNRRKKFLLLTETMNYENMQCIVPYMHRHNIQVSAIFYDAIPVLRTDLCSRKISENHGRYMTELASCDFVFPIARHNELDLRKYWEENGIQGTSVRTIGLAGEMDNIARNCTVISEVTKKQKILFVSTLEPRKNHKCFLKAFTSLMDEEPRFRKCVSLTLVGNRYAGNDDIPEFVEDLCKKYTNIKWLGVVNDKKLQKLYQESTFTVYPSQIEGYGMPVMESLWFGKPCLCSDSGSIGELGASGGCCLTDVFHAEAMKRSLLRLLTDEKYFIRLQNETVKRKIITWNAYTNGILDAFAEMAGQNIEWNHAYISDSLKRQIKQYLASRNAADRVIVCSNYYPPDFIGGAEIIAHSQSRVLVNDKNVPVVVFSLDTSGKYSEQYCYAQHYDGLLLVRFCISDSHMNPSGVNFFHMEMNEAFRQLCELIKPTVVHSHNIIGMSLGILEIAKESGAAVCITLHDHWGFCLKNTTLDNNFKLCDHMFQCETCKPALNADGMNIPVSIRQAYFRKVFEKVDTFISPSKYLANAYIHAGFSYHHIQQLWNGIDTKKYAQVKKKYSEKFRISFVGHFGKHKGIELLIRAVAFLERNYIEIELAGDGEEAANYRNLAAELGILNQIRFWEKLDNKDMPRVFAETDVYCLPSIWPENQPVSITEAMACGIPVIASDLGGNRELVRHGINGFLFRPNDVQDLAEKICALIDDKEMLQSFGIAGKEMISKYDITIQASRLLEIYQGMKKRIVRPESFISIKGNVLPDMISDVTDEKILLLDWIILEEDYAAMKACIVLSGEKPDKKQMESLKKYGILMMVPQMELSTYKKMGFYAEGYDHKIHLLEILSDFA